MMLPRIFGENLFEDFMDFPFDDRFFGRSFPSLGRDTSGLMKTDVKETDNSYNIDIDLPGYSKDDVTADLKNGYLTISAVKDQNNDEKDKDGRYLRRERYVGRCSRSFYVGTGVKKEDINAKFEDGILKLCIPKKSQETIEQDNRILIEG